MQQSTKQNYIHSHKINFKKININIKTRSEACTPMVIQVRVNNLFYFPGRHISARVFFNSIQAC